MYVCIGFRLGFRFYPHAVNTSQGGIRALLMRLACAVSFLCVASAKRFAWCHHMYLSVRVEVCCGMFQEPQHCRRLKTFLRGPQQPIQEH